MNFYRLKISFFFSFIKDIFTGYRIKADSFFFLNLKMSFHFLLFSIVSDEQSYFILIVVRRCIKCDFFPPQVAFEIIFSFQHFDYDVYRCSFLCIHPVLDKYKKCTSWNYG